MQVCGFTILRDGVRFGYPFVESIKSVLPLVDRFVIQVGDCSDNSLEVLEAIGDPKIEIEITPWDPEMRKAGEVLAYQTNLALDRCDGDWCFYIQADEVIHEADYPAIQQAMKTNLDRPGIDGLRFRYLHFRGDYNIRDPLGYRRQVRIVRNDRRIRSVGDACGFGKNGGRRLVSKLIDARVFHYGYVRPPKAMAEKTAQFQQFYVFDKQGKQVMARNDNPLKEVGEYIYDMQACVPYRGSHPALMQDRIAAKDWETPPFQHVPLWRNKVWWHGRLRKAFPQIFDPKTPRVDHKPVAKTTTQAKAA
ncbi:glycosyltransferase family 2 protein [Blastopirellula marina]|uniref:Glycosyl transferase n=1 Tax=Blastopirellula marina TaxID=124 RepID=A0A2S8GJ60_9BACT|nr:glycosyltransferase family 2 protein [Blastopirellula marina]PQO44487.1 glycosyl transferase [Blastopirellula marina]